MELYLLTEASTDIDLSPTPFLHIDGRAWQRIGPLSPDEPTTRPEFACISYVWGSEHVPNPLDVGKRMSDQTPLVLVSCNQSVDCFSFLDRCLLYTGDTALTKRYARKHGLHLLDCQRGHCRAVP